MLALIKGSLSWWRWVGYGSTKSSKSTMEPSINLNPPAQVVNISTLYNCRRPWSGFYIPFPDNSMYVLLWQYMQRPFFFWGCFKCLSFFQKHFLFFRHKILEFFFYLVKFWLIFLIVFGEELAIFLISQNWKEKPWLQQYKNLQGFDLGQFLNPWVPILVHFFKFKHLQAQYKNQGWVNVHIIVG
jgi:hypothetical protein